MPKIPTLETTKEKNRRKKHEALLKSCGRSEIELSEDDAFSMIFKDRFVLILNNFHIDKAKKIKAWVSVISMYIESVENATKIMSLLKDNYAFENIGDTYIRVVLVSKSASEEYKKWKLRPDDEVDNLSIKVEY